MAFHVYILRCADGSYYTGHTDNIEARLAGHREGTFGGYTSKRGPVELGGGRRSAPSGGDRG